jgi:hypothetical protein
VDLNTEDYQEKVKSWRDKRIEQWISTIGFRPSGSMTGSLIIVAVNGVADLIVGLHGATVN